MQTISYDRGTLTILGQLKSSAPHRIFLEDSYCLTFDYGSFHVVARPVPITARTQNDSNEAIIVQFERIESAFQSTDGDNILYEGKSIDRLWILRTFLYFTDYVPLSPKVRPFRLETSPFIADTCTGIHYEIACHPLCSEAQGIDKRFANLVDTGIALKIDGEYLLCFAQNNSFTVVGRVMSEERLREEVAPCYEFIDV